MQIIDLDYFPSLHYNLLSHLSHNKIYLSCLAKTLPLQNTSPDHSFINNIDLAQNVKNKSPLNKSPLFNTLTFRSLHNNPLENRNEEVQSFLKIGDSVARLQVQPVHILLRLCLLFELQSDVIQLATQHLVEELDRVCLGLHVHFQGRLQETQLGDFLEQLDRASSEASNAVEGVGKHDSFLGVRGFGGFVHCGHVHFGEELRNFVPALIDLADG